MKSLPQTGTAALLDVLSPYLDDEFINRLFPVKRGRGRRHLFAPSQLFRVLLLNLLTPAHSFNLLVQLLAENRSWRDFASLRHKRLLPDAKMLHQFRDRLHVSALRQINPHLLAPILAGLESSPRRLVALIDSTDWPAATHSFKKRKGPLLGGPGGHREANRQKRAEPVVHRL